MHGTAIKDHRYSTDLYTAHFTKALEFQLELESVITGTGSHPDLQKIRIIGFFFENRLHWQFSVQLLVYTVSTYV
jgi:hypothetical protein